MVSTANNKSLLNVCEPIDTKMHEELVHWILPQPLRSIIIHYLGIHQFLLESGSNYLRVWNPEYDIFSSPVYYRQAFQTLYHAQNHLFVTNGKKSASIRVYPVTKNLGRAHVLNLHIGEHTTVVYQTFDSLFRHWLEHETVDDEIGVYRWFSTKLTDIIIHQRNDDQLPIMDRLPVVIRLKPQLGSNELSESDKYFNWDKHVKIWFFHVATKCVYGIIRIAEPVIYKLDFTCNKATVIVETCPLVQFSVDCNGKPIVDVPDFWKSVVLYRNSIIGCGDQYQCYRFDLQSEKWYLFPRIDSIFNTDSTNVSFLTDATHNHLYVVCRNEYIVQLYYYCEVLQLWKLIREVNDEMEDWNEIHPSITISG